MKHMYTWINGLGESRKRSTLERLRKEAVRDHRNIRLSGEGGAGGAEGSTGQNYGHQAQASIQGYVQNLTGLGGGRPSGSHSSSFAPSFGGGGSGGFPNIPGIPGQLPNLFGGSGFGNREGPQDALSQPSPYASSYAPPQPSYDDGAYRSGPPEPGPDRSSTYASPYAPSYAPSYPGPSGGGYQPSYGQPPPQFGFSGGTGGYGDSGGMGGFSGGLGYGWPSEPQPQEQNEGANPGEWQGDRPYGFSGGTPGFPGGTPGFPDPEQRYGF